MRVIQVFWFLASVFLSGLICWMIYLYHKPVTIDSTVSIPLTYTPTISSANTPQLTETARQLHSNQQEDSISEDLRDNAKQLASQGLSGEAIALLEAHLHKQPDSAPLWVDLGSYYAALANHDEAFRAYEKALQLNPKYARAFHKRGQLLLEQERLVDAQNTLIQAIQLQPHYKEAHYTLAQIYEALKDNNAAIKSYKTVTRIDRSSTSSKAFARIGQIHINTGDLQRALSAYSKALERDPTHTHSRFKLASLLNKLDLKIQAAREYEKLLLREPNHFAALTNRAIILKQLGQLENAFLMFQDASELKPSSHKVWYNLGLVCRERSKLEPAIQYFKRALSLKPNYNLAHEKLGDCFLQRKQVVQALHHYNHVKKNLPKDKGIATKIANIHYKNRHYKQAISQYQELIEQYPNDIRSRYKLGKCYYELKQFALSAAILASLTDQNQNHYFGYFYQGMSYLKLNQLEQAEVAFSQACSLQKSEVAFFNLGLAREKQDKVEQAIAAYKKALIEKPNHESSLKHLAKLLLRTNKTAEAEHMLQRLKRSRTLALNPNNDSIQKK